MTDTKALNDLIDDSGVTKTFLAKKMGISRQSLGNKISNRSTFDAREIEVLCRLLNIKSLRERDRIFFAIEVE